MLASFARLLLCLSLLPASALCADKADVEKQRNEIRAMRDAALADFYKRKPELKAKVRKAPGYAVFSDFGITILFVGGSGGRGIAVDNRSGKEVFMNMGEVRGGLGVGLKDFRTLFVFKTRAALTRFTSDGWEAGGRGDAAAKAGEKGAAASDADSVHKDVEVYQITKTGLIAQGMVAGTKYWRDADLN